MEPASPETRSRELIGLVDGHSYYCSCHRLFEPSLIGKPLCVLSSNDSAVVSRTDEAKALGVKMSQPRRELEWLVRNKGLVLRSSNYPLYQDMHRRMMQAISDLVPQAIAYSIDEAFIRVTGMKDDLTELGKRIQRHILKHVGIPTGVGISVNCTSAKLANYASKKWKKQTSSVVALTDYQRFSKLMSITDVGEVWGIGNRIRSHLESYGINNAIQLANADAARMRKLHGVGLARTIRELNWEYCIAPDQETERKSMACTRTFPVPAISYDQLRHSIVTFASVLGAKLRAASMLAGTVTVFIAPASASSIYTVGRSKTARLTVPTNDSRVLIEAAVACLNQAYANGSWIRAGLNLGETITEANYIPDLFAPSAPPRSRELMQTIDRINRLGGVGSIRFGSEKVLGTLTRKQYDSPRFTTQWSEIPLAGDHYIRELREG